ncbi:hypothetical protein [Prescottella agglutinans]|uniref:Uncharacterized protein n=1 Tax=Prescottella agglutinans TaxID=1644129 RepID=A0ABT6MJA6_9NOCA|nr:hypothetical protein [Prescottella agglutinans]MDH6283985.1 hypothetical protein [Prescottella agglutinans]
MNRDRAIASIQDYAATRRAHLVADGDGDHASKTIIRFLGTVSAALWVRVPVVLDDFEAMWREALEDSASYERPLREIAQLRTLLDAAIASNSVPTLDVELFDLTVDGLERPRIAQLTLAR